MSGALRYTLVVRHPETNEATALLAGEQVPDWASELVQSDDLENYGKTEKRAASKRTASK